MTLCQSCERERHEECDGLTGGGFCDCPCQSGLDYANEAKRGQADLVRKARKENG